MIFNEHVAPGELVVHVTYHVTIDMSVNHVSFSLRKFQLGRCRAMDEDSETPFKGWRSGWANRSYAASESLSELQLALSSSLMERQWALAIPPVSILEPRLSMLVG